MNHGQIPDNEALLMRIADGDEQAFVQFYKYYYPQLRPFVFRFFSDPGQAEDAMQECFIRVWLNRDQLPTVKNVLGWMHTIVSRICINAIRNAATMEKHLKTHGNLLTETPETPEEQTLLQEVHQLIETVVSQMPPARKRIYMMSRTDGLSPAEIAEKLSLSISTVRNTLVIALREIRVHLSKYGFIGCFVILFLKPL